MTRFPISIPLVIHDVEKSLNNNIYYKCIINLLAGPIIRWEYNDRIIEHELFGDESKFFLIAAVRLGKETEERRKGKSSVLNQLFSTKDMFSSILAPGASYGKPLSLDGSIELAWLTKETCSSSLWEKISANYRTNRLLLLANLHGNSLEFKEQLRFLEKIASHFLVFIMPEVNGSECDELISIVDQEKCSFLSVKKDQPANCIFIDTNNLTAHETLEELNQELAIITNNEVSKSTQVLKSKEIAKLSSIKLVPAIQTNQSKQFMDCLKK